MSESKDKKYTYIILNNTYGIATLLFILFTKLDVSQLSSLIELLKCSTIIIIYIINK